MKKLSVFYAALVLFTLALTTASAQVKFGIKTGLNLSSGALNAIDNNYSDIANSANYNGFMIGPTLEVMKPLSNWGCDISVLYSQKGISLKDVGKASVSYIEIPLNLKYKVGLLDLASIYGTAGPYVSYGFPRRTTGDVYDFVKTNAIDIGGNVGFGVEILSQLQVGMNYSFGFPKNIVQINNNLSTDERVGYKNKLWTLSATLFF